MRGRIIEAQEPHGCELGRAGDHTLGTLVECAECGTWWRVTAGDWGYEWGKPGGKDRKKIAALLEAEQETQREERP